MIDISRIIGIQAQALNILKKSKASHEQVDFTAEGISTVLWAMLDMARISLELSDDETMALLLVSIIKVIEFSEGENNA